MWSQAPQKVASSRELFHLDDAGIVVVTVGRPATGNRNSCKAWKMSGAKDVVGRATVIADGGYRGTGLLIPHHRRRGRRGRADSRPGNAEHNASHRKVRSRLLVPETKSEAGARFVVLPAFLRWELRRHLDWYAEKGPDGLLFVGEKGAAFRRTTFGRAWRRARQAVGLPEGFRFYDLRHTGHTLSTRSGATLKDTMVRAGQSSEKAALIYQHSDDERQRELAAGLDEMVRAERAKRHKGDAAHRNEEPSES